MRAFLPQWLQGLEVRGAVADAVQAVELVADGLGQDLEGGVGCGRQVHGEDGRQGAARIGDLVVDLFQLAHRAAQEDHSGAVLGEGQGCAAAQALARTGDEDDAALEQVGCGGGVVHVEQKVGRLS